MEGGVKQVEPLRLHSRVVVKRREKERVERRRKRLKCFRSNTIWSKEFSNRETLFNVKQIISR